MWCKIISTTVCVAAMKQVAWAGVVNAPGSDLLAPTAEPVLLASTSLATADINEKREQLVGIKSKRSEFNLDELFNNTRSVDGSLGAMFLGMAFIGIVVGGIRLEILRRRAEKAAFYGTGLARHRSHRLRNTVIYVEIPRLTSSGYTSAHRRRRRRRRHRSSRNEHGHSGNRHRHRSCEPTHPVTVEGRLTG